MSRTFTLLTGMGLGAGLMYMLDPDGGRRRQALVRDKAMSLVHDAEDAADVVRKDLRNRLHGLASGDLSVLVGGRRSWTTNPLRGGWSPAARGLMGLIGGGMFLYGLTQQAPKACFLGTIGLALAAEGYTNAGIEDINRLGETTIEKARQVADTTRTVTQAAGIVARDIGLTGQHDGHHKQTAESGSR